MTTTDENYKWRVLVVVMVGTIMSALNASIVNIAIPNIMAAFGSSVDEVQWVITAYMLGFAVLMPLTAWLRERIGYRLLYLISLAVFVIGSVLCGVAWNLEFLVFARVIQALGGGAITPTAMAMIAEAFDPSERGKAIGVWTVGVILGPAIGPTLGGYLTESLGWRSIFNVSLPIGVIALAAAVRVLKHDKPVEVKNKGFDFLGFGLLTTFLISALLALSEGNSEGWFSPYIVGCELVAIFSIAAFLLIESVSQVRILDLSLFKYGQFTAAMVVTCVRSIALYGGTFLLPLFMQQQMGLDEISAGVLMLPGALVIGLVSPFSGRLLDVVGPRPLTIVGLFLTAMFMFMYRDIDANTSTWGILGPMFIRGVGLGLLVTPISAAAMNAVPTPKAGMASSMLSLIQQVSGSVGIALLAAVLSHRTVFWRSVIGENLDSSSPAMMAATGRLTAHLHGLGYGPVDAAVASQSLIAKHAVMTAAVSAFGDAFMIGGLVVLVGVIPALFLAPAARAPKIDVGAPAK